MATSKNQEKVYTITCVRCKKQFEGFSPTQAYDCATDVYDPFIAGNYGSEIADLTIYQFASGKKPDDLDHGQICDACITDLFEDGTLLEEPKNYKGSFVASILPSLAVLEALVLEDEKESDEDIIGLYEEEDDMEDHEDLLDET